ncbi:MAG TPA: LysM peptidoglycan-binding domain-containing protein [Bacteroidia bacterium]|nr:LysM peptidoglycan-binding domain-containing protein [Bacteroidia bacterium]HNS11197.1 LysM peptidoglycan-binding domain-containing protein [Bacteroidia bacterium]
MRFFKKLILLFFIFIGSMQMHAQQYQLSKKDTSDVRFVNSRKFWIYKVEKGETLFSISQKFKIPQEEIHEFNPEIAEKGLKAKMKLWIPAYSWLNKKDKIESTPQSGDSLSDNLKERFNILVLTTLNLSRVYIGDAQDDSTYIEEALDYRIKENLEFLEGLFIASRDVSDKENKIKLIVDDTEGDSLRVNKIFSKLDISSVDIIITNEHGSSLRAINNMAMKNSIPLFSAGTNTTDIIQHNPAGYSLVPSSLLQCELMGSVSSSIFKNANCLFLKTGINREDERGEAFIDGWVKSAKQLNVKKVKFSSGYSKAVKDSLSKVRQNVLFVPTSNEDIISSLLSSLKELTAEYKISVIGLPTWLYSQSIDPVLFDTCNAWLFSAGFIDYDNSEVTDFRIKFRDHYHTEPSESAYLGYDALKISFEKYSNNSGRRSKEKRKNSYKGIYSTYKFVETDAFQSKENHVIHIYNFFDAVPVHVKIDDNNY